MDNLEIKGKNYIKVSVAAKETGYTADYIGQLARAGKIDAELVGRSWYILEDALIEHKQEKKRSNYKKTKEYASKAIAEKSDAEARKVLTPEVSPFMPAYRKHLLSHKVEYVTDSETLIPHVGKAEVEKQNITAVPHTSEQAYEEKSIPDAIYEPKIEQGASESSEVLSNDLLEFQEASAEDSIVPVRIGSESEHDISEVKAYKRIERGVLHRKKPAHHTQYPVKRASLLPVLVSTVLTLFILAVTIFAENSWEFESGNKSKGERAIFRTSYGLSNIASVYSIFSEKK